MKGEVRYSSLELSFPENAKVLFAEAEDAAKAKLAAEEARREVERLRREIGYLKEKK